MLQTKSHVYNIPQLIEVYPTFSGFSSLHAGYFMRMLSADHFFNFFENSFWNTITVLNSADLCTLTYLDPDQARHIVGPELGPDC